MLNTPHSFFGSFDSTPEIARCNASDLFSKCSNILDPNTSINHYISQGTDPEAWNAPAKQLNFPEPDFSVNLLSHHNLNKESMTLPSERTPSSNLKDSNHNEIHPNQIHHKGVRCFIK